MSLLIFSKYLVLRVKFAYRSYKKPLRTALNKIFKSHLTPTYIFRGPIKTHKWFLHIPEWDIIKINQSLQNQQNGQKQYVFLFL